MAQPSRRTEPLRRAATVALVAAVAGPTLWLGGAPPGAAVLATLLSATALGPRRLRLGPPRRSSTRAPSALRRRLCASSSSRSRPGFAPQPTARRAPRLRLVPLGLDGWRPLSHDPPATAAALTGSLSAAAALVAAAGLCRSRTSRRHLAAGIGLTGVAVALIGFGHALADASTLFGLHRFQNSQLAFLTPFGNPNHLAAFATLASALLLGLAADSHPHRSRQALWLAAAVAVGAAAFLSLSRGGIAFWCAGQLAFLLLLLRRRDAGRAIPIALAVGMVAFVAGYLALDRISAQLSTVDTVEKLRTSKVDLWPMFSRPALAAWLTGLGRGTFALAFRRWQTAHSTLTFTFEYPENLLLQLGTELGLLPPSASSPSLPGPRFAPPARATAPRPGRLGRRGRPRPPRPLRLRPRAPACATAAAVALGIASAPGHAARAASPAYSPRFAALAAVALPAVLGFVRGADSAARAEARLAAHATGNAASVRAEARAPRGPPPCRRRPLPHRRMDRGHRPGG
jgi:uncharacterized membrane protein YidH (DUF202 family)